VVGVWIGNDDNSSLRGINGGGLPARIWRDFMSQSIRNAAPVIRAKTPQTPDPEGPIEPLDLLELQELPIDIGNSEIRVDQGQGVTVNTDVNGVPFEITLDRDGANIQPTPSAERPAPEPR
jgi:penicillin-binding protein 1A